MPSSGYEQDRRVRHTSRTEALRTWVVSSRPSFSASKQEIPDSWKPSFPSRPSHRCSAFPVTRDVPTMTGMRWPNQPPWDLFCLKLHRNHLMCCNSGWVQQTSAGWCDASAETKVDLTNVEQCYSHWTLEYWRTPYGLATGRMYKAQQPMMFLGTKLSSIWIAP